MSKVELFLNDENGNNIAIPSRDNNSSLTKTDIEYFYKNIVVLCENDDKSLKGFYINSKEIKFLKEKEKMDIVPTSTSKSFKVDIDKFYFILDKKSTIPSLFFHIRNSFTHNRIKKLQSGEIEMFDVVPAPHKTKKELEKITNNKGKRPKARITMYSRMSSLPKLKRILSEIIKTQR